MFDKLKSLLVRRKKQDIKKVTKRKYKKKMKYGVLLNGCHIIVDTEEEAVRLGKLENKFAEERNKQQTRRRL